jgi:hypothetical protein
MLRYSWINKDQFVLAYEFTGEAVLALHTVESEGDEFVVYMWGDIDIRCREHDEVPFYVAMAYEDREILEASLSSYAFSTGFA